MNLKITKIIGFVTTMLLLSAFVTPVTLAAVECDADSDGYIVIPTRVMKEVTDAPYNEDGNYSPLEWQEFFKMFKAGDLTENEQCLGMNFKKGAEPKRCDAPIIGVNSNVYDPSVVTTPLRGAQVNPGANDAPDNSIDENCDGADASLLAGAPGGDKDLSGLADRAVTLASRLVVIVSVLIMIWGGVLYATAAGDEGKTSKARKAIIGAVIGLIVGLLAPTIVNLIVANLV